MRRKTRCLLQNFYTEMRGRSTLHICVFGGLFLLIIQLCLLALVVISNNRKTVLPIKDIEMLMSITSKLNIPLILADRTLLQHYIHKNSNGTCMFCNVKYPLTFVLLYRGVKINYELLSLLEEYNFIVKVFHLQYPKGAEPPSDLPKNAQICLIVKRNILIRIVILHERAGNFWWHGNLANYLKPTDDYDQSIYINHMMDTEAAFDKFEVEAVLLDGIAVLLPKDVPKFLRDSASSRYIECDIKKARAFHHTYGTDMSRNAKRFEHRAWKVLSRAKTILDKLNVEFWLSSGTCLGYFRQCGIIPWSKDVDIGIFINNYNDNILSEFMVHGFTLKHWFGKINDSLEVSFLSNDIKLDLFFFYEDGKIVWNGGTQAKTGKKFKYIFPRFTLCWTQFLEIKVRVPCETLAYVQANYGSDWYKPITKWDWKSSPSNVQENGMWPKEEWPYVIKVYPDAKAPSS